MLTKEEVLTGYDEKYWNIEALIRFFHCVWCLLHRGDSLFIHHYKSEPSLISLQVLVLLGFVQSASECKYLGLQEALAHLHGLMIERQTASPGREKYTVVFLCHYVRTDKFLNLLPRIKIVPVAHGDYGPQTAVIPAQSGKGLYGTSICYYSKK